MSSFSLRRLTSEVCWTSLPFSPSEPILTTSHHTLNFSWHALDNVGIRGYYIALASPRNNSGHGTEAEFASTAGQPHYSWTDADLLASGNQFYVHLQAEDFAGSKSNITIGPILIDLSPPYVNGSLQAQQIQGHVIVTWEQDTFTEEEDIEGSLTLRYAIGKD